MAHQMRFGSLKDKLLKNNSKIIQKSIDSVKKTLFYLSHQRHFLPKIKPKNKTKQWKPEKPYSMSFTASAPTHGLFGLMGAVTTKQTKH
jgi:hypothetical protein